MAVTRERIETLWMGGELGELTRELAARRTEWSPRSVDKVASVPGAAALGILTLRELDVPGEDPLVGEMVAALEAGQEPPGNWGGPRTTALVLRSLAAAGRGSAAYARGLAYLSLSQSATGGWVEDDGEAYLDTAFVLSMLGDHEEFRHAVDVERAVEWYVETRFEQTDSIPGLLDSSERQWTVALQRVGGSLPPGRG